jgi:hypothetical protein
MPRAATTAALATIAVLALAVPAEAKKVTSARVCGASECREITEHRLLVALPDTGEPTDPPSHPSGGWFLTTIRIDAEGAHERFAVAAFPTAGYVRVRASEHYYNWMPMTSDSSAAYAEITRELEPRPLSSLPGFKPGPGPASVGPVASPGGDFPWVWISAVAASLVAAAGILLIRRRRPAAQ